MLHYHQKKYAESIGEILFKTRWQLTEIFANLWPPCLLFLIRRSAASTTTRIGRYFALGLPCAASSSFTYNHSLTNGRTDERNWRRTRVYRALHNDALYNHGLFLFWDAWSVNEFVQLRTPCSRGRGRLHNDTRKVWIVRLCTPEVTQSADNKKACRSRVLPTWYAAARPIAERLNAQAPTVY